MKIPLILFVITLFHLTSVWVSLTQKAENMSLKTTGAAISGSWGLRWDEYPTSKVNFTQAGLDTSKSTSGSNKIIEWGWDMPTATFVKNNITKMEQKPFDGIAIILQYGHTMQYSTDYLSWQVFKLKALNINDSILQADINAVKTTNFQKFIDNFLVVDTANNNPNNNPFIDWFDNWSTYINNLKVAAQAAKQAGLKGIILDTENYNASVYGPVWQYDKQKYASTKTLDQYKAQAKLRGQQVMEAINSVYPGITILVTFGTGSVAFWQSKGWPWKPYELVVPFIDGMMEKRVSPGRIVEGFEPSYYYKTEAEFTYAYNAITVKGKNISSVPNKYDSFMHAGFGLWLNYRGFEKNCSKRFDWNTTNFQCNWFNPEEFRKTVCLALKYSRSYVWVYSEKPNWWTGSNLPQAYIDAISQGKENYQSGADCQ